MATARERTTEFVSLLEEKQLKHEVEIEDKVVSMYFGGSNFSFNHIKVIVHFDEDGNSAHLVVFQYVHVPEEKKANALFTCNDLNRRFRWGKFSMDSDCDILVETDAVIDDATGPDECLELVMRLCAIADEAYPEFMKGIWGSE